MVLPVWVLIGLSVWFGIKSNGAVALAHEAADHLLTGGH